MTQLQFKTMREWWAAKHRDEIERMVRCYASGLTDAQVQQAISRLQTTDDDCVWHAVSSVTGSVCACRRCQPDIK